jgi:hypothetical protein
METDPQIKITGAQRRLLKQTSRQKPPQPTILKRSTARNLKYLAKVSPTAEFPPERFFVPISTLRRRGDGTLVRNLAPQHGA